VDASLSAQNEIITTRDSCTSGTTEVTKFQKEMQLPRIAPQPKRSVSAKQFGIRDEIPRTKELVERQVTGIKTSTRLQPPRKSWSSSKPIAKKIWRPFSQETHDIKKDDGIALIHEHEVILSFLLGRGKPRAPLLET